MESEWEGGDRGASRPRLPSTPTDLGSPRSVRGGIGNWRIAVGWVLAAGVSAVSLSLPISVMRAPIVSGSNGVDVVSTAVTTFDAWGGSTTVYTGADLNIQIPGGPNYAVAVLFCAVLLMLAAAVLAVYTRSQPSQPSYPSPRPLLASALVSVGATVAAGGLLAVAGCQLLAHQAAVRPYQPGGPFGAGVSAPDWELGWSCWLVAAGGLIALTTCVILFRSATATMARRIEPELRGGEEGPVGTTSLVTPSTPLERGPDATPTVDADLPQTPSGPATYQAPVDPAIFRRPGRSSATTDPHEG